MFGRGGIAVGDERRFGGLRDVMLIFRWASSHIDASQIAVLRKITELSISEIRARVGRGEALIEIEPFANDWQDRRRLLVSLSRDISRGGLPMTVAELVGGDELEVTPGGLENLVQHYRAIELETRRNVALETGEIADPKDFEPDDEDWTR